MKNQPIRRAKTWLGKTIVKRPWLVPVVLGVGGAAAWGMSLAMFGENRLRTGMMLVSVLSFLIGTYYAIRQLGQLVDISSSVERVLFNDVTLQIFSLIQENKKLSRRMREGNVRIKRGIGELLEKIKYGNPRKSLMSDLLLRHNVFVESGSTLAYLALKMNDCLSEMKPPLKAKVFTNNVLAYILLLFQKYCSVILYPGTPTDHYGATYGAEHTRRERRPATVGSTVTEQNVSDHQLAIGHGDKEPAPDIGKVIVDPSEMARFFGGVGYALERSLDPVVQSESTPKHNAPASLVQIMIMTCSRIHLKYGPHVGSQENADFKHFLLEYAKGKEIPVLFVVDASKFERSDAPPPRKGECFPIYRDANNNFSDDGCSRFANDIADGKVFLCIGCEKNAVPDDETFRSLPDAAAAGRKIGNKDFSDDSIRLIVMKSLSPPTKPLHAELWEAFHSGHVRSERT